MPPTPITASAAVVRPAWREIGERVYVRRHASFDVNVGLIVGTERCVVIDTLSTYAQAADLIHAIREVTDRPWTVVNTHAHFDHCFGNAMFRPADIWGHSRTAAELREFGATQRETLREFVVGQGKPELLVELDKVVIDPPNRIVEHSETLEIGGRTVVLQFLGRGHTDGDIVVGVPDCGVVFTGDLIEQGAPPSFEDAFPMDWPGTAAALLPLATGPVVPGHGDVVDRDFVERQAGELAVIAEHARVVHAAGRSAADNWSALPLPEPAARTALARALWQLDRAH